MKQILKDYVCTGCLSDVEVIGYTPRKTRCTYCGPGKVVERKKEKKNESN